MADEDTEIKVCARKVYHSGAIKFTDYRVFYPSGVNKCATDIFSLGQEIRQYPNYHKFKIRNIITESLNLSLEGTCSLETPITQTKLELLAQKLSK